MNPSPIARSLSSVALASQIAFENVVMFPLVRRDAEVRTVADYQTLNQALDAGLFEITEISEQGSVPELRAVNHGLTPTLIVDGEELVGAKQNRVVNLTLLVPAAS